jgi:hypothetical protein
MHGYTGIYTMNYIPSSNIFRDLLFLENSDTLSLHLSSTYHHVIPCISHHPDPEQEIPMPRRFSTAPMPIPPLISQATATLTYDIQQRIGNTVALLHRLAIT